MKFGNMSRLGKKPIEIPEGVEVKIESDKVIIKGPLGELVRSFVDLVIIEKEDNFIKLKPKKKSARSAALWGTYSSLLASMISKLITSLL